MSVDEMKINLEHLAIMATALEIVLSAPLWPKRKLLSLSGQAVHDLILRDAKPYALAIAEERHSDALGIASGWSDAVKTFMDATLIDSPDTLTRMTNRRMLRVYQHYLNAIKIHWVSLTR